MLKLGGFWSYAHADDGADGGRIVVLGRDIADQYEMLTGESVELFLDRDSLDWGNAWREKVDGSLATVAFFIPVLTPRYFQRLECRHELRTFAGQAEKLGVAELLMPLQYMDFPLLHEEDPSDPLVVLVKRYQWANWTELRFADRASREYRIGVADLAARLVAANVEATKSDFAQPVGLLTADGVDDDDDAPGLMDRMADAEDALPEWSETIERIGAVIEQLGELMQEAGQQMNLADKRGKGFAGRLTVARNLANSLVGPADEIIELGNRFAKDLTAVDSGIRAIIEVAPAAAEADPEERQEILSFFESMRALAQSSETGLGQIGLMLEELEPIEKMSRDLREPLRRMRQGLTAMMEGREITNEWVRLMDATEIATNPTT